jgi:ribonuclease P protein component
LSTAVAPAWRIRDRATFAALRDGRRGHAGPVRLTWVPEPGSTTPPRVAFAVGRRVGSAVERNRLRRQLRAVVADLAPDLEPGAYLIAYRGGAGTSFADLVRQVAAAATTAGALVAERRP